MADVAPKSIYSYSFNDAITILSRPYVRFPSGVMKCVMRMLREQEINWNVGGLLSYIQVF